MTQRRGYLILFYVRRLDSRLQDINYEDKNNSTLNKI